MYKFITRSLIIILCFIMLLVPAQADHLDNIDQLVSDTSAGLSALGGKTGTLMSKEEDFPAGTSVCDWTAIALALSGSQENYPRYLQNLQKYVETNYEKNGGLDHIKSTPYHRIALTALALGSNPREFGTKSDGTPIDLVADGTYAFAGNSIGDQGLNGWIYALITLDAENTQISGDVKFTREDMIHAIISAQEPDGGFGLIKGKSDVDITAMALQALAPYAQKYPLAVDNALAYLSGEMNEDCLYSAYGTENAESSAQVILALCALGIQPETDMRFCRGENTLLSGLKRFHKEDNTFGHTQEDAKGDFLATAQALLALTALQKLYSGNGRIFDFTDYTGPNLKPDHGTHYAIALFILILIVLIIITRKRKKHAQNNR